MTRREKVDLAIIGSGSGNSLLTPFWDDKRVAIAEQGVFGGTCLNVGCIPTKMFVRPASLAHSATEASRLGVDLRAERVDWRAIRDRIFGRIDAISEGGRQYRAEAGDGVLLVEQRVRLAGNYGLDGPRLLEAQDGTTIEASQVVIAAGSRAVLPDIEGIDLPGVHTSDTVMRIEDLPTRVVVLGGGTIACEFAGVFAGLGASVIQLVRGERMMKQLDTEIGDAFAEAAHWDVRYGQQAARIEQGADCLRVIIDSGSGEDFAAIDTDIVLVATGRRSNSDRVGAAAAGLDLHADGRIVVDPYQRVTAGGVALPGVYALGDVSSALQLKHVANYEARVVAHNIENPLELRAATLAPVPEAIFSQPEMAVVGLTEAEAIAQLGEANVTVKTQRYGDTAYGWAMEDGEGLFKVVAERETGLLLGAHAMGYQASNLLQPVIMAMSFGIDARSAARGQYWIHPALMEVVENALLGLDVPAGQLDR